MRTNKMKNFALSVLIFLVSGTTIAAKDDHKWETGTVAYQRVDGGVSMVLVDVAGQRYTWSERPNWKWGRKPMLFKAGAAISFYRWRNRFFIVLDENGKDHAFENIDLEPKPGIDSVYEAGGLTAEPARHADSVERGGKPAGETVKGGAAGVVQAQGGQKVPVTAAKMFSMELFGFKQGMSKAQVLALVGAGAVKKDLGDQLALTTAPRPHEDFEFYEVAISETLGIAKVIGIGETIETNSFGDDLKSKFLALQEALTAKFGKPDDTHDFLRAGSIWNERRDWMMGLLKKERVLASFWKFDNGAALMLEANALSDEKGYIDVSFDFPNFVTWKQEHDQKKNAAF